MHSYPLRSVLKNLSRLQGKAPISWADHKEWLRFYFLGIFCPEWKETENPWVMFSPWGGGVRHVSRVFSVFFLSIWNFFVVSQNTANVELKHIVLADEDEIKGDSAHWAALLHTSLRQWNAGPPSLLCRSRGEVLPLPLTVAADSDLPKKVPFDLIVNQYDKMIGLDYFF